MNYIGQHYNYVYHYIMGQLTSYYYFFIMLFVYFHHKLDKKMSSLFFKIYSMLFIQNTQFKSIKKHKNRKSYVLNRINVEQRLNNYILCSRICICMYIENVCYISYLHQIIFYDDFQLIVFIVLTCEMLFALHFFLMVQYFMVFFFFYVAKDAVNGLDFFI